MLTYQKISVLVLTFVLIGSAVFSLRSTDGAKAENIPPEAIPVKVLVLSYSLTV